MKKQIKLLLFLLPILSFAQKPELVVPIGHTAKVNSVVFSPNGKTILTGSTDGTAKLWDLEGKEVLTLRGHGNHVSSVAFSPNGKTILTGSWDRTAKLWDLEGKEVLTLKGHNSWVNSVAFSPDGKTMLTGSYDKTAKLWNLEGEEVLTLRGHGASVSSVVFSPDGETILTGSGDRTAKLWDLEGKEVLTLKGHTNGVNSVVFSPDGETILTGSGDKTAKLWDLEGKEVLTLRGHGASVSSVVFSPDGKKILTGSRDKTAKLWDLEGKEVLTLKGHTDGVISVVFSPDGETILTGSRDRTANLWDLEGKEILTLRGQTNGVSSVVFSPDGKKILTGSRAAKLWDLEGEEVLTLRGQTNGVSSVVFSPDGETVFMGSTDGTAKLWDLEGKEVLTLRGEARFVSSVVFSPDGETILTGSRDKTAKLWDLKGKEVLALRGHGNRVISVAFSPDGKTILTGSGDRTAKLWDLEGKEVLTLRGHARFVSSVAFSPDGETILTGSRDRTAKLWDLEGKEILTFKRDMREGHTSGVTSVAFSPDGKTILTGSMDRAVKLWDLEGKEVLTLRGHDHWVSSVAFSPDGETILTGSRDMTAKLWNLNSGKEVATLSTVGVNDWIVTTPSGLFDASPGAMNLMHYSVFYKDASEYLAIDVEQLKARYYEPGLLQKLLGYSYERIRPVEDFEDVKLYPKVASVIEKDTLNIILSPRNGGIGKVSIFINGKEVVNEANPLSRGEKGQRDSIIQYDLKQHQNYLFRHPDSTNIISIRAYNEEGWLKSKAINLEYKVAGIQSKGSDGSAGNSAWVGQLDPKLYVISIGTSNYSGTKLDLQYADQDATMMAKALQSVGTALFTNGDSLEVHCLTTANPDSTDLENTAIQWHFAEKDNIETIFKEVKSKAKAEDVIIVYLSGHGVTRSGQDETQFYYLTQGVSSEESLSDPATLKTYTISSEELTKWINDIPALKQVLIIDACNSGQIVENLTNGTKALNSSQIRALDRMKDRTGMFVLSGSASDKVSYEASEYGQGLLTYALLQGMLGVATRKDTEGKETIDVMKLFQHARDQVPELAKSINGIQTPMLGFPSRAASFDIGILDEKARQNIPIGNKKPVAIRSLFQNQDHFGDDLDLVEKVETTLREETQKGKNADFIFVDVNHYPNAYSLKGLYQIKNEEIHVKVRVFYDNKPLTDLEIPVTTESKKTVRYMIRAFKRYLEAKESKK